MKRFIAGILSVLLLGVALFGLPASHAFAAPATCPNGQPAIDGISNCDPAVGEVPPVDAGAPTTVNPQCNNGDFFGLPPWYKYVQEPSTCEVNINSIGDIWLIVLAIIELLTRAAAVVAIIVIIYAGVRLIMSKGDPDKISGSRDTIIRALIGLGIAIGSTAITAYVAHTLGVK